MTSNDLPFLDANVLFSAVWAPRARMRRLWALQPAPAALLSSDQAVAEARRNLAASKHDDLLALLRSVRLVATPPRHRWLSFPVIQLPDNDMAILQAAIAGGATHLLTGDRRHFGPYYGQRVGGVLILPPAAYPPGDARVLGG